MKIIQVRGVDRRGVQQAVEVLNDGEIILYPTDTLYALGCNAMDGKAVERLCKIKGVDPQKNTLSIVCGNLSQASQYARIDNVAFRILKHNLPGPFTFLLPVSTTLPKVFKGRKMVGIRVPDNDFIRAVAEELDAPILSTSISPDGGEYDFYSVTESNNEAVVAFDDYSESKGIPSTVVDLSDSSVPEIVRQGIGVFEE